MIRVCFIAEQLDRPELNLIQNLQGSECEVELLLDPDDAAFATMQASAVHTEALKLSGRYSWSAMKQIRAKLKSGRFDVVHCLRNNRPVSNTVVASIGLSTKLVAYRGTAGNLSRLDPASWMTYFNPRLSKVVCVSDAVRKYLLGMGVPKSRLITIYKGHDTAWYQSEKTASLKEFGIPEDAFVVGMVANLRELKGVDTLLAAAELLPETPKVHICLIGNVQEPEIGVLIDQYAGKHPLHWLGFRTDASQLSGAFHIMVMPSKRREGLPRAVIEAMSQGVPAVVTSVGGMPELVQNRVHGRVVEPNNPQALATGIRSLIENPTFAVECGLRAQARIEEEFNIQNTVEQTLAMYQSICS